MRLAKRTYSLPPDLVARFEERLEPGQRSGTLAQILRTWLTEREREEMRAQVIAGCDDMAEEYALLDRDWSGAADEAWRES